MFNYRDHDLWKSAMDMVENVYMLTDTFPKHEAHGLTEELRRAAVSIPSKIAEACTFTSNEDSVRFFEQALGSCFVVETLFEIAKRRSYIPAEIFDGMMQMLEMLKGLLRKIIINFKEIE